MRILIADDSPRIRESLRTFLMAQPGMEICGEAADGVDAVETARDLQPDLIVLDFSMPRMNGLEAGGKILREVLPQVPLILFTMHKNDVMLREANAAGFKAVVSKVDGGEILVAEIQRIAKAAAEQKRQKETSAGQ
jgi:DNA-binding NarL/FixJ family response regulator